MNRSNLALTAAILLGAAGAHAYIRATASGVVDGPPLFRTDFEQIEFLVQDTLAPDLRNADGRIFITPTSEPLAAIQGALDVWGSIETSAVRFAPLAMTAAGFDNNDGLNVFVFDDSPAIRSLTGTATAVTVLRTDPEGEILESDIVFNPNFRPGNNQIPFSTNLALNSVDLQAVATHHVGRSLGADNSGVIGAAMSRLSERSQSFRRDLSTDDVAFATNVYPAPGVGDMMGEIFGTITAGGAPAKGVLVTAVDPFRGILQTTLTSLEDGTYSMRLPAEPQGRYFVYTEPLDGPLLPSHLQVLNLNAFTTDLRPSFFGNNNSPRRQDIGPGRRLRADISAEASGAALRIDQIGVSEPGLSGRPPRLGVGPIRLISGRSHDIILVGLGIDATLGIDSIRLLVPGVEIRPGTIRVDPAFTVGGGPVVRFTVDVAPRAIRQVGSVAVIGERAVDFFTGALVVEAVRPEVSQGGAVNAASFEGGPLAPGGLATLFGSGLGPAEGVAVEAFDPATGLLPSELAGVSVTFDGIPAPLVFVIGSQINLQVPYELAGRTSAVVVVTYQAVASEEFVVQIGSASPGIFQIGDTQAAAVNTDGSINGPATPASRNGFLTLFATGAGQVMPPIATGAPAGADPLSRARNIRVRIGGVEVPPQDILFAGLAPGFVGLLQVNVRLSGVYPAGEAVEVAIEIDGQASQTATVALL